MGWIADLLKEIPSAARYKAELVELASEHSTLQTENQTLKAENLDLRSHLEAAQKEIERLRAPQDKGRCSEAENNKILLLLTGGRKINARQIASSLNASVDRTEACLSDLHEAGLLHVDQFASYAGNPANPALWHLTTEGQKYLVRNELIQ